MAFAFDLISDLHIDTWADQFNWTGQATSPFCLVIGDIAQDRSLLLKTLAHLGSCYQAVFYIDGNHEHQNYYNDLPGSYEDLAGKISKISNVVYLHDNVIVINGVAILGANGWWGFDFDPTIDFSRSVLEWQSRSQPSSPQYSEETIGYITALAQTDANYLGRSIKRLQRHYDVRHIVVATHTVPLIKLISHDPDLEGNPKINWMGNSGLIRALDQDTENKVHTWCFGHYHSSVDQIHQNIRFVNNCRGKGKTDYSKSVFHPKRIVVDN
jgi:hypothetical protein